MRQALLHLCLIAGIALSGCGSGKRADINQKLQGVKARLQVLESQMSADDNDTAALIDKCKDQIRQIQQLLIEDETKEAESLLEQLLSRINNRTQQSSSSDLQIFGQVDYVTDKDTKYQRLFVGESLDEATRFRTGVRSAIQFKPNENLDLFLQAQSEVELNRGNAAGLINEIIVYNGEVLITSTAEQPPIVRVGKLILSLRSQCIIEILAPGNADYPQISLLSGVLDWDYEQKSGSLVEYQGLITTGESPRNMPLPLAPQLDDPTPDRILPLTSGELSEITFRWHSKFFAPAYQIQISDNNLFVTRIYDNNNLTAGTATIHLPVGQYFWRARGINSDRVPGPYSRALSFSVSASAPKQPSLSANAANRTLEKGPPIDQIDIKLIGTTLIVSGHTDPNAKVNVNGISAIMMDSGNFRAILNFETPGTQTIRISSVSQTTGAETAIERKVVIGN